MTNDRLETLSPARKVVSAPRPPVPVVSTVLRIHDIAGRARLERAIQTLHAQQGVRVQPIVVAQRFDTASLEVLKSTVDRQWFLYDEPSPVVLNLDNGDGDSRSILMNLGIAHHLASGNRFLAFLDHDDLLYTHAYRLLIERIEAANAAIAFATVESADVVPLHDYEFVYNTSQPYRGGDKLDLIRENFCPLHSYLVDTDAVDHDLLFFRPDMTRVEDYDFLLRVAGPNPCDFKAIGKKIGLYIRRADGSNSTPFGQGRSAEREFGREWKDAHVRLEGLRAGYQVNLFASDF